MKYREACGSPWAQSDATLPGPRPVTSVCRRATLWSTTHSGRCLSPVLGFVTNTPETVLFSRGPKNRGSSGYDIGFPLFTNKHSRIEFSRNAKLPGKQNQQTETVSIEILAESLFFFPLETCRCSNAAPLDADRREQPHARSAATEPATLGYDGWEKRTPINQDWTPAQRRRFPCSMDVLLGTSCLTNSHFFAAAKVFFRGSKTPGTRYSNKAGRPRAARPLFRTKLNKSESDRSETRQEFNLKYFFPSKTVSHSKGERCFVTRVPEAINHRE